jgi:hypothetical protein
VDVLTAAALVAGGALAATGIRRRSVTRTDPRARPPRRDGAPEQLARLRRAVDGAASHAGDAHLLLRPVLRVIAAERLLDRGLSLEHHDAEALLGSELWQLVRPDRPPPRDMFAPGLGPRGVERVIEGLERL